MKKEKMHTTGFAFGFPLFTCTVLMAIGCAATTANAEKSDITFVLSTSAYGSQFQALFAAVPQGLDADGNLVVVKDGVESDCSSNVKCTVYTNLVPLPGQVGGERIDKVALGWKSNSGLQYDLKVSIPPKDEPIMAQPAVSIPKVGKISSEYTYWDVSFICRKSGAPEITVDISLSNFSNTAQTYDGIQFKFKKECGAYKPLPKFVLHSTKFSTEKNKDVKVSSWNIGISGLADNSTNNIGRLNTIGAKLQETKPDVILLQECWNSEDKVFFKNYFKTTLPNYLEDSVGGSSGLLILSKFPFVHGAFARFTDSSGADALSNKGVLGALLDIGEKRLVYIWNTHLNAGGGVAVSVRHKQFEQLSAFVKTTITGLVKSVPTVNVGVVLAGDLNTNGMSDNQDEYNTMMAKLSNGAVDIFRKKHGLTYDTWPKLTAAITCTCATISMR